MVAKLGNRRTRDRQSAAADGSTMVRKDPAPSRAEGDDVIGLRFHLSHFHDRRLVYPPKCVLFIAAAPSRSLRVLFAGEDRLHLIDLAPLGFLDAAAQADDRRIFQ